MRRNLYYILFLLIAFIMLYVSRIEYGSFSLSKSMKACVIAQKKIYKDRNIEDIKIFCKTEIEKNLSK